MALGYRVPITPEHPPAETCQGELFWPRGGPSLFTGLPLLVVVAGLFVCFQNPFAVGGLFLASLSLTALILGALDGFLGLVVFIIYLGGAIVLFSYCFMLSPLQAGGDPIPLYPVPLVLVLGLGGPPILSSLYEFYWVLDLLLLLGVLLFVVIVRVVENLDIGRGTMRVG